MESNKNEIDKAESLVLKSNLNMFGNIEIVQEMETAHRQLKARCQPRE